MAIAVMLQRKLRTPFKTLSGDAALREVETLA